MSAAIGSAQSMRQQLDELDALLQRMLTLPINQVDDPPPAASRPPEPAAVRMPAPRPAQPESYKPPRMRLLTDSSPVPPPVEAEPVGYARAFSLNLNPHHGSSVLGSRSPAAETIPDANDSGVWRPEGAGYRSPDQTPAPAGRAIVSIEPLPAAPPSAAVAPAAAVSAALRPAPPPQPRTPIAAAPLVVLDQLFDTTANLFGAPGEWLTSPVGKNLLGYAGLLMLGGCAAWGVLDWFGWTH